jgi:copper chaperone CopZ
MKTLFITLSILFSFHLFAAQTFRYSVPDMTCGYCAKMITSHLVKRKTLKKDQIKFNIEKKQVDITFSDDKPLSQEDLAYLKEKAGYTLKQIKN